MVLNIVPHLADLGETSNEMTEITSFIACRGRCDYPTFPRVLTRVLTLRSLLRVTVGTVLPGPLRESPCA